MTSSPTPHQLTRRQLYRLVWVKPLAVVAKEMGLSANGLSKICDRVGVPYPPRGYWGRERAGRAPPRPELADDPTNDKVRISITPERSPSRRARSRLPPEKREEQLIESAKAVVARLGVHRTNMKRIAAEAGISEAQAHNYFTRDAILVELARRELREMEEARQSDIVRGTNARERADLGTVRYLHEVDRRGALLQVLLTHPAVREALRKERRTKSAAGIDRVTNGFAEEYNIPVETVRIVTRVLTTVSLRAGRLLANRKTDLATAERILMAMVAECNQRMIDDAQRGAGKTASEPGSARRSRR